MRRVTRVLVCLAAAGAMGGCGGVRDTLQGTQVRMLNSQGREVGTATLREAGGSVEIQVSFSGLNPGFYGFHIHETGICDANASGGPFMSAGNHFNPASTSHGKHAGDLPPLLVNADGRVEATVRTDAFRLGQLTDNDGSALILHSGSDNLANIPDRYRSTQSGTSGPDQSTLSTGDADGRLACGLISGPRAGAVPGTTQTATATSQATVVQTATMVTTATGTAAPAVTSAPTQTVAPTPRVTVTR